MSLFKIQRDVGTGAYVDVGDMRSGDYAVGRGVDDVSNETDGEWQQGDEGAGNAVMSISGLCAFTDEVQRVALRVAATNRTFEKLRFIDDQRSFTGPFQVTSFRKTVAPTGAVAYEVNFESVGAIVEEQHH